MNTQKALSAIEEARTGRGVLNLPIRDINI